MSDPLYTDDLAAIHVEGYDFHVEGAAAPLLTWLRKQGIVAGTVLDLGCGGGQWLQRLTAAGYHAVGVDVSKAMLREARQRAPQAELIHGSFADVALPPCAAATSLGEPLNYLDGARSIRRTLKRVYQALRPGGLFIFDVRHPGAGPVAPRDHGRAGADWACVARIEENPRRNELVRTISTFRRVGRSYRRREEVHRLKVYSRGQFVNWLEHVGFDVAYRQNYGGYRLSDGQSIFLATKPEASE